MSRAPVNPGSITEPATSAPSAQTTTSSPLTVSAGTYEDGYQLGQRNGGILVGRLQDRTVGLQGCDAVPNLEDALIKVTRTIRPPAGCSDALARGFFRGYLDAIREGVRQSRNLCSELSYTDGGFAGNLYGSLLCQVTKVSVDVVSDLTVDSLYQGWSGGSANVISECRSAATVTLQQCGVSELSQALQLTVDTSCSDNTTTVGGN